MAKAITCEEFSAALPSVLMDVAAGPIEVLDGQEPVAVILSAAEYNTLVKRRGERAFKALQHLQQMVEDSGATHDELLELERALDRKAS